MSIIVILNYGKASLTKTQVRGIVESIEEEIKGRGDGNCLVQKSVARALDLSVNDGVEGVPLSDQQWRAYAVIPYMPPDVPGGDDLLAAINQKRGYEYPIVREREEPAW